MYILIEITRFLLKYNYYYLLNITLTTKYLDTIKCIIKSVIDSMSYKYQIVRCLSWGYIILIMND